MVTEKKMCTYSNGPKSLVGSRPRAISSSTHHRSLEQEDMPADPSLGLIITHEGCFHAGSISAFHLKSYRRSNLSDSLIGLLQGKNLQLKRRTTWSLPVNTVGDTFKFSWKALITYILRNAKSLELGVPLKVSVQLTVSIAVHKTQLL